MSYQVLARKWRPRNFRETVGQEHVLKALINALDHDRLHHAYLFTGTRGVGKTTIARILAKCLNCETGVSSEPCGECGACVEINEGRFVDLIEVDAASRTKVEDTRELLDNVQYAPTRGRYKIYLIDEVHMLSNHSFNALLKTLEEPPEHVKFLLATTDPQKLPVTILSRCLQFNLKNMSAERIVGHLQDVLAKEMVPFDEPGLWLLARAADGSMRDALSLTDQAISFGGGKVSEQDVASMLGTIDYSLVQNIICALIDLDGQKMLEAVAQFSEHAPDYNAALADLTTLLHRIAIAQAVPEALDNSYGDRSQILDYAQKLASEDVQLFYQIAVAGRRDLPFASSPRSGFEMTLLRMLAFKPQGVADVPKNALPGNSETKTAEKIKPSVTEVPDLEKKSEVVNQHEANPPVVEGGDRPVSLAAENITQERVTASEQNVPHPVETSETLVGVLPEKSRAVQVSDVKAASQPEQTSQQSSNAAIAKLQAEVKKIEADPKLKDSEKPQNRPVENKPADTPSDESKHRLGKVALADFRESSWNNVYSQLSVKGILQTTVSNCLCVGINGSLIYFLLDETKASLYDSGHTRRLADLLSDYFGEPIQVELNIGVIPESTETPAICNARIQQEHKANLLHQLHEDPVVQALKREFSAVVDESTLVIKR